MVARFTSQAKSLLPRLFCLSMWLLLLVGCESQKTIVNQLDEKSANEIIVFLAGKGIPANKILRAAGGGGGGGKAVEWDISVSENQATDAMSMLNQAGLPRRPGQSLLNIFSNAGLVPSDLEQKIRYEAGQGEQIANTIRKIDGILDAEVLLSFPQEDPLNPGKYKGKITASVYVKHSGVLDDPNSHLMTRIRRLVAASVTGLDYDNVTIIPDRARFSELQSGTTGVVGGDEKQYVNVWSIVIAKDSLLRFRIIFFSFVVAISFLLLWNLWLMWKFYPLLRTHGGIKKLFSIYPLSTASQTLEAVPKGTKKAEEGNVGATAAAEDEDEDEENK